MGDESARQQATTHLVLDDLLKRAVAVVEAMTPEERAEMVRQQRESWARGEMGMGETSVTINPQPRKPLKTDPSLDYTAGFAAGIEAAVLALAERRQKLLDDRGGYPSAVSDEAGSCIGQIRDLKPGRGS